MKKRVSAMICVLLALCILSTTAVCAETLALSKPTGLVIELDDLEEDTPEGESYTVIDNGEAILKVGYVQAPGLTAALSTVTDNGYYTADFTLPDGVTDVFLTGLTQDNVSEIEQAIADGYADGSFKLTNLGFIDAEKTLDADDDDYMCWAAASSNLLTYTGWAAQAGYNDTDDLFELFINSFDNKGGHAIYGIGWFFNGIKATEDDFATPVNYPDSGGYLPDYAYDDSAETVDLLEAGTDGINTLYQRLRSGYGVALNVRVYQGSEDTGGHAVTCWGFVTDSRYPDSDKAHYKSVIITDSDSDELSGVDRRTADDVMRAFSLTSQVQGTIDTYSFIFPNQQMGLLYDSATLRPYSTDIIKETNASATKDRRTTADLMVNLFYLDDTKNTQNTVTKYAAGSDIYFAPYFMNAGDVTYNGDFTVMIKVTDSSGATVYSRRMPAGTQSIETNYYLGFGSYMIPNKLSVGDYTITAEVNANHQTSEAYYYNNARSIDFKVRDTYLLGDTDGDGIITILDVTCIQHLLAGFSVHLPDNAAERGDADASGELDISDATLIQRYNVYLPIDHPVGDTQLYN